MKEEFHALLRNALKSGEAGYFHIGKGPLCRKFTFDGRVIHNGNGQTLNWFPSAPEILESIEEEDETVSHEEQTFDFAQINEAIQNIEKDIKTSEDAAKHEREKLEKAGALWRGVGW